MNPIAVNSPMVNVFTENKRVRVHIETEKFGDVQFVAIGATAVGSIRFTVEQGSKVKKGDELGYFAFGGSTIITLIPKGLLSLDGDVHFLSNKCVFFAHDVRAEGFLDGERRLHMCVRMLACLLFAHQKQKRLLYDTSAQTVYVASMAYRFEHDICMFWWPVLSCSTHSQGTACPSCTWLSEKL